MKYENESLTAITGVVLTAFVFIGMMYSQPVTDGFKHLVEHTQFTFAKIHF